MVKKYIIELEDKPFHKEDGDFLYRAKGFNSLVFDMTGIGKLTPYTEPDLEQVRKEAYENGYGEGYQDGYSKGMNDYLQNPEVKEESDRAYAHGYSDAESKFSEIRKEAYEQGQKDLRESCVPKDEEAYGIGYNEGFQCGLDLAWHAARKLYEIDWDVLCDLFGKVSVRSEVLDMFTALEALQKLRVYEQEKDAKIKVWDEICCIANSDIKVCVTNIEDGYFSGFTIKHPDRSNIGEVYSHRNIVGWEKTGGYFSEIAAIFEKTRNEPNVQIDT